MSAAHFCPRRDEGGPGPSLFPEGDDWKAGRCTYCGSMAPDKFMRLAGEGVELTPTDKNYKVYVKAPDNPNAKFYFQHLDEAQRRAFVELLNAKTLNLAYPGRFYVLPFFVVRG